MLTSISEVVSGIIVGLYNVISEIVKNGHPKETVQEHIVRNEFIQNRLETLLRDTKADRACIFQFHNGGAFFAGQPMKKISCTYEAVSSGILDLMGDLQNRMVSEYPVVHFSLLKNNEFSIPDVSTYDDNTMKQKWENNGVKTFYAVGVWDLSNNLIGNISLSFIKEKGLVTDDLKKKMIEFSNVISGYLTNNKIDKQKNSTVSSFIVGIICLLTLSNIFFICENVITIIRAWMHW